MRVNIKRKKAPLKEGERRAAGRPRKNVMPDGDDDKGTRFGVAGAVQVDLAQLNKLKRPVTNFRMAV
jgi:hypothetical protein